MCEVGQAWARKVCFAVFFLLCLTSSQCLIGPWAHLGQSDQGSRARRTAKVQDMEGNAEREAEVLESSWCQDIGSLPLSLQVIVCIAMPRPVDFANYI